MACGASIFAPSMGSEHPRLRPVPAHWRLTVPLSLTRLRDEQASASASRRPQQTDRQRNKLVAMHMASCDGLHSHARGWGVMEDTTQSYHNPNLLRDKRVSLRQVQGQAAGDRPPRPSVQRFGLQPPDRCHRLGTKRRVPEGRCGVRPSLTLTRTTGACPGAWPSPAG